MSMDLQTISDQVTLYQADYIRQQYDKIDKNDLNLPTGIWLPDVVLRRAPEQGEDPPEEAWVEINYREGFPALGAVPFWERLPNEPLPYWEVFKAYLDLQDTKGTRSLFLLVDTQPAQQHSLKLDVLRAVYDMYYWGPRTQAYDLYNEAARRALRSKQARELENEHFDVAQRLFQHCSKFLDEDKISGMSPSELINLFKTAIGLQRISVGLPMQGVTKSEVDHRSPGSMNIGTLMMQLVQEAGGKEGMNHRLGGMNALQELMGEVMDDPEGLELIQKLILRMQVKSQDADSGSRPRSLITRRPPEGEVEEGEFQEADAEADKIAQEIYRTGGGLR